MIADRQRAAALRAWAILRAGLIPIVVAGVLLVDHSHLHEVAFWSTVSAAAIWAAWLLGCSWRGAPEISIGLVAAVDVVALSALTYESGGAFSQLRKAFILLPLVAALISTPRATAAWAAAAVLAFVGVALPHPTVDGRGGIAAIVTTAIYLAWCGLGAVLLARLARTREQRLAEIADGRRRLVSEVLSAEDRARKRLAYALHDDAMQSLLAARRDLDRALGGDAPAAERVRLGVGAATRQLREAVRDLHPHTLEDGGLAQAVGQLAQRVSDRAAMAIDVDLVDADCDEDLAFALIRELVGNIEKHSGATRASIVARAAAGATTIVVSDDGRGMSPAKPIEALSRGHIGLASVRERIEASGGSFSLDPGPGVGVTATITLAARAGRAPAGDPARLSSPPASPALAARGRQDRRVAVIRLDKSGDLGEHRLG